MARASADTRTALAGRFLLRFRSDALETGFWNFQHESRLFWIRAALLIAGLMTVGSAAEFMPFVADTFPGEMLTLDRNVRVFLIFPLLVSGWLLTIFSTTVVFAQRSFLISTVIAGLAFSSLMWFSGSQGLIYYNYSFIHVLLFLYVMILLPFRLTVFAGPALSAFHVTMAFASANDMATEEVVFSVVPIFSVCLVLTYGAYFLELAARTAFLSTIALNDEYEEKLRLQQERSSWLGVITDFLRHEMKNSIIGISSSLDLLQRKNTDASLEGYLARARKSIRFMKRMLQEASAATSLETTLNAISLRRENISRVMNEKLAEYRDEYPDFRFDAQIDDGVYLNCDVDKVVQMIDKLVNNALEHGAAEHPINLGLACGPAHAVFTVTDIGEPLTGDPETIFQPFTSTKANESSENFGFGLYIVQRIALAHRGTVSARRLDDPPGAEFSVSIPLDRGES